MAECFAEGTGDERPCTVAETAMRKQLYENKAKQDREAGEDVAALIGFNPIDVDSNKKLATELMQYPGWKQVTYLGKGAFHVEYEMSGTLDRDFAFPVIPQVQMAMPFVNTASTKAGVVNISAAGLTSQQLRKLMVGQTPQMDQDDPHYLSLQSTLFRANGTFTVLTDAEITMADGKRSQSAGLQRLEWIIDGKASDAPKIQLRLDPKR
jgi:hypothetical protein